MDKTQAFAILAAVPEIHLLSGVETIAKLKDESSDEVKIAFGSMAFELFRQIDQLRNNKAVEMFIYASNPAGDQPLNSKVSWQGLYIGHSPSRNGRYSGKARFRPPSTATDKPTWAIFWELQELHPLSSPIAIASLKGLGKKSNLTSRFIPEDPLLIEYL